MCVRLWKQTVNVVYLKEKHDNGRDSQPTVQTAKFRNGRISDCVRVQTGPQAKRREDDGTGMHDRMLRFQRSFINVSEISKMENSWKRYNVPISIVRPFDESDRFFNVGPFAVNLYENRAFDFSNSSTVDYFNIRVDELTVREQINQSDCHQQRLPVAHVYGFWKTVSASIKLKPK